MSRNVKPYEVLAGPVDVYFGLTGTPFPGTDDVPADFADGSSGADGENWVKVGYTEGGVKVAHAQTVVELRADQVTAPIKAIRSEEGLEISFSIVNLTLENYALALNQAIDGPDSGSGEKTLDLYRGGSLVETLALLCRSEHLSPEGDFPIQYEAPVVFNTGAPEVDFVKDNKSVLACSFHAIADPDRTDEDKAFGVLRIGTE
jgi:hypothetical protein